MRRILRCGIVLLLAMMTFAAIPLGTLKLNAHVQPQQPPHKANIISLFSLICTTPAEAQTPALPRKPSPDASPIGAIKFLPDGSEVTISYKCVTHSRNSKFYIQEADRSSGIRAFTSAGLPVFGDVVSFTGTLTTVDREREILINGEYQTHFRDAPVPDALYMKTGSIVGGALNYFTPGIPDFEELHTAGLRVQVCGKVTSHASVDQNGDWYFYIDDGCGIVDGATCEYPPVPSLGVRVYSDNLPEFETFKVARGTSGVFIWDPTPNDPTNGDELPIRALNCAQLTDIFDPGTPAAPIPTADVTGTIRLVGATTPVAAKIYGVRSSTRVMQADNTSQPFTLPGITTSGTLITASAPGFLSQSILVYGGDSNVIFELQPAAKAAGIWSDKVSIRTCESQTAIITAVLRDCEGKPLSHKGIKLTTTRGIFVGTGTNQYIGETDDSGYIEVTFGTGTSGAGIAELTTTDYPEQVLSATTTIVLVGPVISVSASNRLVDSSGLSNITAILTYESVPISGANISFITDHGGFIEAAEGATYNTTTNGSGIATATLHILTPGSATVLARYTDSCNNQAVGWTSVARQAAPWQTATVQTASPLIDRFLSTPGSTRQVAVVTSIGKLTVWDADGSLMWEKDAYSAGNNTPSCGDIDADPTDGLEIVVPSELTLETWAYSGSNGNPLAGWPTNSDYEFWNVAAALADTNLDGELEVVAGDRSCYVFSWNSTGNWEDLTDPAASCLWRNITGGDLTAIIGSTVAVGDINGDSMPDVIVGTQPPYDESEEVYAFPGDAWGDFSLFPYYVPGWPRWTYSIIETSPAIGDIDGDSQNDLALGNDSGMLYIFTSQNQLWQGYEMDIAIKSSPALADLNGDGRLDVIFGSDSGRVYAIDYQGRYLNGWENGILLPSMVRSSPVVADINNDDLPEVVVGCSDGFVYAIYNDGIEHQGTGGNSTGPIIWSKCAIPEGMGSAEVLSSPAIDDIDADNNIDIIVGSTGGIFRYELTSTLTRDTIHMPWPTFHHDNARTGFAGTTPTLQYASIVGRITQNGEPVLGAEVHITFADDSPVPQPASDPPVSRGAVLTVGNASIQQSNKGAYSINQLEAGVQYKLRIVSVGNPNEVIDPFTATLGLNRIDITLP